jgi:serine/threonine-protein kinase
MERLDGEDLAARLKRVGRLDEAEVRRIGAAIADGMGAAHERGLIHRDLKPANILILGDGQPKIVDFGIAKLLAAADGAVTGPAMGTPHYMAPEQLTDGAATPSVDVWALGVTLFEAATGTLPFSGFADGRCPQLVEAAPRPSERAPMSVGLETLILQCLRRGPAQRPATMREIAERLRGADDEAALERPTAPLPNALAPSPAGASTPSAARRWMTRAAAAGVAIALASLVAWRIDRSRAHEPPPAVVVSTATTDQPSPTTTLPAAPPPPAPSLTAAQPPPAPPTGPHVAAKSRPHRHAAHHVRSRVYGEKLD